MYELQKANKQTIDILYEQLYQNPPFAWFPTTPKLIDTMIRLAKIKPGTRTLEPTAGDGKIAEKLKDAGAIVDVIEYDPLLQQILFQKGFNLVGNDFLTTEPQKQYELILANPPFSSPTERGIDIKMIARAYELFLQPGGRLISVVSKSMYIRNCALSQKFRGLLTRTKAKIIELPIDTFQTSDRPVTVETWLIVINKKATHQYS